MFFYATDHRLWGIKFFSCLFVCLSVCLPLPITFKPFRNKTRHVSLLCQDLFNPTNFGKIFDCVTLTLTCDLGGGICVSQTTFSCFHISFSFIICKNSKIPSSIVLIYNLDVKQFGTQVLLILLK